MDTIWTGFTPLETLLLAALGSVVGGIIILAKWFYTYMSKTNKERSEEIKCSVQIQTELKGVLTHNNYLIEQLPERLDDKIKAALKV